MIDSKKFLDFAAGVFEVNPGSISFNTRQGDLPEWDSMAHLKLIMGIQSEFGVTIPLVEFSTLKTLKDVFEKVSFFDK